MIAGKRERTRLRNVKLQNAGAKLRYNIDIFSVVAPKYRRITKVMSFGRDRAWKRLLLSYLPPAGPVNALDLACGPGDLTFPLALRYPEARIVGLDASREMLALAEQARYRAGITFKERISFMEGDMTNIEAADGAFDLVTGGYALRNAPSLSVALREIHRVMAPGGSAAFLDFSRSANRLGSALGFRLLRFWGQLWGMFFHGDPDIYAYIAYSLRAFPDRRELKRRIRKAGFVTVRDKRLLLGFLAITRFKKPAAGST